MNEVAAVPDSTELALAEPRKILPEQVKWLGEFIKEIPGHMTQEDCKILTAHFFCDGIYMRQFFLPKDMLAVGMVHRYESFFMIVFGDATITTADGSVMRLQGPYITVTQPGGQRIVSAHEDTLFMTFHANPSNSRDIDEIEARLQVRDTEHTS